MTRSPELNVRLRLDETPCTRHSHTLVSRSENAPAGPHLRSSFLRPLGDWKRAFPSLTVRPELTTRYRVNADASGVCDLPLFVGLFAYVRALQTSDTFGRSCHQLACH